MNPLVLTGAVYFVLGFLVSRALHPLTVRLARRFDLMDHPGHRKLHHEPTPLSGGMQIFGALVILAGLTLVACFLDQSGTMDGLIPRQLHWYSGNLIETIPVGLPIAASLLLVFLTGVIDDLKGARVRSRFIWQAVAALLIVQSGIRPEFFDFPVWVVWPIALFWIIGITNAFNLIDGMNGLCTGVAIISSLLFMTAMSLGNQPLIAIFYACFVGCLSGFFVLNFPAAKAFLGSSGSLSIGFMISVTVLMSTFNINATREDSSFLPAFMPVIILTMPLYDTLSVMWIRWKRRRPLTEADQNHFAHRLLRLGFTRKQAVTIILVISFSFGLSALLLVNATNVESLILMTQVFSLMALLVLIERRVDRREDARSFTHLQAEISNGEDAAVSCLVVDTSRLGVSLRMAPGSMALSADLAVELRILGDPEPLIGRITWIDEEGAQCGVSLPDGLEFSPTLSGSLTH